MGIHLRASAVAAIACALIVAAACGSPTSSAPPPSAEAGPSAAPPVDVTDAAVGTSDLKPAEIIARDLGTPWEIACDAQGAFATYEVDGGRSTVYRLAPGAAPAAIAAEPVRARHVAVDEPRVFWTGGSTGGWSYVRVLDKTTDGGQKPAEYFADGSGSRSYSFLTVREGHLAYAMHNESAGGAKIIRGRTDGNEGVTIAPGPVLDLALDGTTVYWISPAGDIQRGGEATDGGSSTMFLAGAGATSVAILNGEVVFTSDDGVLRIAPIAGGEPRTIATGLRLARELVLEGADAFWVDTEDGSIATVPLAGGTPKTIALASSSSRIAVCGGALWFTNPARRSIERLAR